MTARLLAAAVLLLSVSGFDARAFELSSGLLSHSQLGFQLLTTFSVSDDGSQPGSLIQGTDGSLYGTASGSGNSVQFANGLIFKLGSSAEVTVLSSFPPFDTNGFSPRALVQAGDGNFYGTTTKRGSVPDCGTIFRLRPTGERTNILHFSPNNGCSAQVLIAGSDGNLYGLAGNVVFKLTMSGQFTVLHENAGPPDFTRTALLEGRDGNLYGAYGSTVFRLSTQGVFSALTTVPNPEALVEDNGNLYGTDALGGDGFGSVFRLTPEGALTTLASFHGTNGVGAGLLIQGMDRHLYGVTEYGGPDWTGQLASGSGTIFQLTLSGTLTTLASSLPRADGLSVSDMRQGRDGNLYLAVESEFPGDPAGIVRLAPRPVLAGVQRLGGQDVLTWTSFVGGVYQLEYKPALSLPTWRRLPTTITATQRTTAATNTQSLSAEGYYRVGLLP